MKNNYPEDLPISEHREEIMKALREHDIVIVCGDTGSGKTTQLPKMALELGRAANGRRIACTQPRRLATISVAERVANELQSPIGDLVGYQHRYDRRLSPNTKIKFMTDGTLLAETRADPLLRAYDTIIIDEAHERSLNVDFLLGILKRILQKRHDLKVVISSATLDTSVFSKFFWNAPAIIVPGRLYPIEIRYRPPTEDEELDLPRDISSAIRELPPKDDILVFLPGERDIRDTADHLSRSPFHLSDEIIPLLASLPASEQKRAFRLSPKRRVILATNVAETSVTLPGIRAVIDSGLARISRHIHRTQIQRLQIEPISQASAAQRAGRCGRIAPGICIRLYSEKDLLSRDKFTPPEILRSSLAGVILTMLDLRLGDIETFPFIEPPKPAMIREGLRELVELGAITHSNDRRIVLTQTGRNLARIPIEPRLARMMLAASQFATLPSALPVIASMSCDDPRRRPADERDKATAAHAPFRNKKSDFLGTLQLWNWWLDQTKDISQTKARALAKKAYLSYAKMREWRELVHQLAELAKRLGLDIKNDNGGEDALHRALLTGLLPRIGHLDPETYDYRGAHGLRFSIHPSSAISKAKTRPEWIVAGELVDTSRLFARSVAIIDPEWLEPLAGDICRHSYHSPEWDPTSGFVRVTEQVTLYGLVIVPARRRDFSRLDPAVSRDVFIRAGIIENALPHPTPILLENASVMKALRDRAEKFRDQSIFDTERLYSHFENSIPKDICSAGALKKWLYGASPAELAAFRLKRSAWIPSTDRNSAAFPNSIDIGGVKMRLEYRHSPDAPDEDGITCTVRKSNVGLLRLWRSDWLVPGALVEKVIWLLNALPAQQRKILYPIGETASSIIQTMKPGGEPLQDAIRKAVYADRAIRIAPDAWDNIKLPPHLMIRFKVLDDASGKTLMTSRDPNEVLSAFASHENTAVNEISTNPNGKYTDWSFGTLSESLTGGKAGWQLTHYQALHDEGDGVTVRLYSSRKEAEASHANGVARLFRIKISQGSKPTYGLSHFPKDVAAYLKSIDYGAEQIGDDILACAVKSTLVNGQPAIRDKREFEERYDANRLNLRSCREEIQSLFYEIATETASLSMRTIAANLPEETSKSILVQLAWLVFPGFLKSIPLRQIKEYGRYLRGISIRLDRARNNPNGDIAKERQFAPYWETYRELLNASADRKPKASDLADFRWMLEEYRISLFAQELHTPYPISAKRLTAKLAEIT